MSIKWPPPESKSIRRSDYRMMRQTMMTATGNIFLYAVYWVEYDETGRPLVSGNSPSYPIAQTQAALMAVLRDYTQAVCKPVLDYTTGAEVEGPSLRSWTTGNRSGAT